MRILLAILFAANLIGAAFGFFVYYSEQLKVTQFLLWPFVPDCPLYAATIVLAYFLVKRLDWFVYLAALGAAKYGAWTVGALVLYSDFYFSQNSLLYSFILVSHIVLCLEGLYFIGRIAPKKIWVLGSLAWFLINDAADYLLGTHPPIPNGAETVLFPATVLLTLAVVCAFSFAKKCIIQ